MPAHERCFLNYPYNEVFPFIFKFFLTSLRGGTFVTIDKSNPRAGSAADKAELDICGKEMDYMDVVQPEP